MKKRERNLGFTLIELLVVIAIIGVLASIVLASLNNARQKSRDARRLTDIKQIQLALELYFDGEGNTYPTASTGPCSATNQFGLELLTAQGYMPQIPYDPLSSASAFICYNYAAPSAAGNKTTYHLGATLEDTANSALPGKNCISATGTGCPATAYTNGFDGTAAGLYDVVP